MGTLCSNLNNYPTLEQQKIDKQNQAKNTSMARIVDSYMSHYGRQPSESTRRFIEQNYTSNFQSTVILLASTYIYTNKDQIIDRFQTAYQKRNRTRYYKFTSVQMYPRKFLYYQWAVETNGKVINYNVCAQFDENDRFNRVQYKQYTPYDHQKYMTSGIPNKPQTSYQNPYSNSNKYDGPSPEKPNYDAMLQQSNQQFRQRMNKQAQQWNDYARQKNNRGW